MKKSTNKTNNKPNKKPIKANQAPNNQAPNNRADLRLGYVVVDDRGIEYITAKGILRVHGMALTKDNLIKAEKLMNKIAKRYAYSDIRIKSNYDKQRIEAKINKQQIKDGRLFLDDVLEKIKDTEIEKQKLSDNLQDPEYPVTRFNGRLTNGIRLDVFEEEYNLNQCDVFAAYQKQPKPQAPDKYSPTYNLQLERYRQALKNQGINTKGDDELTLKVYGALNERGEQIEHLERHIKWLRESIVVRKNIPNPDVESLKQAFDLTPRPEPPYYTDISGQNYKEYVAWLQKSKHNQPQKP